MRQNQAAIQRERAEQAERRAREEQTKRRSQEEFLNHSMEKRNQEVHHLEEEMRKHQRAMLEIADRLKELRSRTPNGQGNDPSGHPDTRLHSNTIIVAPRIADNPSPMGQYPRPEHPPVLLQELRQREERLMDARNRQGPPPQQPQEFAYRVVVAPTEPSMVDMFRQLSEKIERTNSQMRYLEEQIRDLRQANASRQPNNRPNPPGHEAPFGGPISPTPPRNRPQSFLGFPDGKSFGSYQRHPQPMGPNQGAQWYQGNPNGPNPGHPQPMGPNQGAQMYPGNPYGPNPGHPQPMGPNQGAQWYQGNPNGPNPGHPQPMGPNQGPQRYEGNPNGPNPGHPQPMGPNQGSQRYQSNPNGPNQGHPQPMGPNQGAQRYQSNPIGPNPGHPQPMGPNPMPLPPQGGPNPPNRGNPPPQQVSQMGNTPYGYPPYGYLQEGGIAIFLPDGGPIPRGFADYQNTAPNGENANKLQWLITIPGMPIEMDLSQQGLITIPGMPIEMDLTQQGIIPIAGIPYLNVDSVNISEKPLTPMPSSFPPRQENVFFSSPLLFSKPTLDGINRPQKHPPATGSNPTDTGPKTVVEPRNP